MQFIKILVTFILIFLQVLSNYVCTYSVSTQKWMIPCHFGTIFNNVALFAQIIQSCTTDVHESRHSGGFQNIGNSDVQSYKNLRNRNRLPAN